MLRRSQQQIHLTNDFVHGAYVQFGTQGPAASIFPRTWAVVAMLSGIVLILTGLNFTLHVLDR